VGIITNKELLAFSQDAKIGTPAKPFTPTSGAATTSPPEFYAGPSSKGIHVFVMNIGSSTAQKSFKLSNVPGLSRSGNFIIHDMWAGTNVQGTFNSGSTFSVNVASHDTAAYLITPA
jgi:alpha-galactosidase